MNKNILKSTARLAVALLVFMPLSLFISWLSIMCVAGSDLMGYVLLGILVLGAANIWYILDSINKIGLEDEKKSS